jgi:hypothetical protein
MSRLLLPLWLLLVPVAAPAQETLAGTTPGAPAAEEPAEPAAGHAPAEAAAGQPAEAPAASPRGSPDNPFTGSEVTLADFLWIARPVVVLADTPNDPSFQRQMELLRARPEALAERGVVVIVDTDPSARSEVRRRLRPRGFALVVLGTDGQVIVRKPMPWDVREISRAIDRTPARRQELREQGVDG